MAFPQIADSNSSTDGTADTNQVISLPANISANDLLIAIISIGDNEEVTWPEGWNEIKDLSGGLACQLSIAWRKADGEEGATITATTASSETSCHVTYRITGAADPDINPPEISTGATGDDEYPNPDSLSPTGGAKDYLWIACFAGDDDNDINAYPANYNDNQLTEKYGVTFSNTVAAATRELNSDSEDPGAFTTSGTGDVWAAATIAIYPEAAAPTGTNQHINVGDTFKFISEMYINIGDAWKRVGEMYINIGDAWKTAFVT